MTRYYPLEVSYYKSGTDSLLLDLLWNQVGVNALYVGLISC